MIEFQGVVLGGYERCPALGEGSIERIARFNGLSVDTEQHAHSCQGGSRWGRLAAFPRTHRGLVREEPVRYLGLGESMLEAENAQSIPGCRWLSGGLSGLVISPGLQPSPLETK